MTREDHVVSDSTTAGRSRPPVRDDLWALVARAQAGEADAADAFGELYEQTRGEVLAYLLARTADRHLAEDLTAETYVRAWRFLGTIQPVNESPAGWLKTTAGRLLLDHHKSWRARTEVLAAEMAPQDRPEWAGGQDPTAEPVCARAELATVWESARWLSPVQRDALVGRYLLGMSVAETAQWSGVDSQAVRRGTTRARQALLRDPVVAALRP